MPQHLADVDQLGAAAKQLGGQRVPQPVRAHLRQPHPAAGPPAQLDLDRSTVRRYAHAASVEELLANAVNRASLLDGYTPST